MEPRTSLYLSVLVAASAAIVVPAQAQQFGGSTYIINTDQNLGKGPCFEFTGDNFVLQATACQSKATQQWNIFFIQNYAPYEAYVIQNRARGTCIAVENNSLATAAPLVESACDFSNPSQHWRRASGSATYPTNYGIGTKSKLLNGRSGKCIDTWPARNGYGYVQQYDCKSANIYLYQMFTFHWMPK